MTDTKDGNGGALGVAAIYPIHQPPALRKKIPLTRPRSALLPERARVEDTSVERQAYIDNHPMVKDHPFRSSGNSTIDALNRIKHQVSVEAASLEFERLRASQKGGDTSMISSRIVAAWKQVATLELQIKGQGVTVLDPHSEEVQRMVKVWIETLRSVMGQMVREDALTLEVMDLFFNKFSLEMEGWESRIET